LDVDVRSSNPPSITLRDTGLDLPKTAACNNGAGGYTERHFMPQNHLTEPQGIIRKTRPAPKERDGFTLVEVLVTLAILAAVLPALLQAFASAARNQGLSDNSTTALYLLKYRMAEIEMEGYPDVGDESDEFGENTRYRWRSVVADVDSEDVENIRRVQVTVTWIHRNRERSISMSTYIADRQIPQNSNQPSAIGSR